MGCTYSPLADLLTKYGILPAVGHWDQLEISVAGVKNVKCCSLLLFDIVRKGDTK